MSRRWIIFGAVSWVTPGVADLGNMPSLLPDFYTDTDTVLGVTAMELNIPGHNVHPAYSARLRQLS